MISLSRVLKFNSFDFASGEAMLLPTIRPVECDDDVRVEPADNHQVPNLEELERVAANMLRDAEARAAQLLQNAESEALRVRDEAYRSGYDEGLQSGHRDAMEAARDEADGIIQQAEAVVHCADGYRRQLLIDLVPSLTQLVMGAVKHLLYRELVTEPSEIEGIVTSMLDTPLLSGRVEVRVSPDEYSAAVLAHPVWQSHSAGEWTIAVVPDGQMSPGGCEIRYSSGRIDASLETKLELLQESIVEFMEQRVNEFVHSLV